MMSISELEIMIMSGPDDGRTIRLSRRRGQGQAAPDGTWSLTFGRSDACDVAIAFDTQVSRRHAILQVAPDGSLWLADAGSLNGTHLDKLRVTVPTPLVPGQLFRIGRTWMRVQQDTGRP